METIHAIVGIILWAIILALGIYGCGFFFELGRRAVGSVHRTTLITMPKDGLLVRIAKTSGKTKKTR